MSWLQNKFEKNFLTTTVDYVFNWARKSLRWQYDIQARLLRN
jgi:NADH-quinone oxidoreductase subunit B